MHHIFSTKTDEYGDWSYTKDETATQKDDWNFVISYIDDSICLGQDLKQCDRRLWMRPTAA